MPKYWTKKDMEFAYLSPRVADAVILTSELMLHFSIKHNERENREYIEALLKLLNTMKRIDDQVKEESPIQ